MMTWSTDRLRRLYERYNRHYWAGKLPTWEIVIASLDDEMAHVDFRAQCLRIDIAQHSSDRAVRATLLHEMCHIAAGNHGTAHGSAFLEQMEKLLRLRAPVSMGFPETGGRPHLFLIPKLFRLCRSKLRAACDRYQRDLRRATAGKKALDLEDVAVRDFEEAAGQGMSWPIARLYIGHELNLLDIDHRPLPWAKRILERGRRAHANAMRERKRIERAERKFRERSETVPVVTTTVPPSRQ